MAELLGIFSQHNGHLNNLNLNLYREATNCNKFVQ